MFGLLSSLFPTRPCVYLSLVRFDQYYLFVYSQKGNPVSAFNVTSVISHLPLRDTFSEGGPFLRRRTSRRPPTSVFRTPLDVSLRQKETSERRIGCTVPEEPRTKTCTSEGERKEEPGKRGRRKFHRYEQGRGTGRDYLRVHLPRCVGRK